MRLFLLVLVPLSSWKTAAQKCTAKSSKHHERKTAEQHHGEKLNEPSAPRNRVLASENSRLSFGRPIARAKSAYNIGLIRRIPIRALKSWWQTYHRALMILT
jgi:hypothetical protein